MSYEMAPQKKETNYLVLADSAKLVPIVYCLVSAMEIEIPQHSYGGHLF